MRKQFFCAVLVLVVGLFLVAPFAAAKMTIKVAHVDQGDRNASMMAAFADTFKDVAESLSGGEMEVKVYPAAQLGGQRELLESTQLGAIQIVPSFTSVASIFSPKAELMAAPFIFPSAAHAWYVLDGPFGRELADGIMKDCKLRVLAYGEANGFRQLWTSKKAVHKPADLKGMKIRVPQSKMILNVMASFGANPVVIPWTELYTSMQTGVADGWEGEASSLVDQKLYETIKHGTLINYSYNTCYIFSNNEWFEKFVAWAEADCRGCRSCGSYCKPGGEPELCRKRAKNHENEGHTDLFSQYGRNGPVQEDGSSSRPGIPGKDCREGVGAKAYSGE